LGFVKWLFPIAVKVRKKTSRAPRLALEIPQRSQISTISKPELVGSLVNLSAT
jgi:hypothetical protein